MTESTPTRLIQSKDALDALVDALESQPRVGLDTESDGFFRYRPKLCLLQLSAPGVCALVDPLAGLDLAPLWAVLARPSVETILHDAEQDVALLSRQYGVTLGKIFDTSYAARLAGMQAVGLSSVLQTLFGVSLDKKEQRSDWARRPLTPQQVSYAALDVEYLLELRDRLEARLLELGRMAAAEQAFDRIRQRVLVERPPDVDAWRTMKGVRQMDARARGVLRAVFEWREAMAAARDLAPFRVLSPDTMMELARNPPKDLAALGNTRGVPAFVTRGEEGRVLLRRITEAEPLHGPLLPPRPPETDADREEAARFELLRAWRSEAAARMGVEVGIIASNVALKALARVRPTTIDGIVETQELLPWQVEAYGAELLERLAQPVTVTPGRRGR